MSVRKTAGRVVIAASLAGALAVIVPPAGRAQSAGQWQSPEHLWDASCGFCHGASVAPELRGARLQPVVIKAFVRNGAPGMPVFQRSELSDADLEMFATWLAASEVPAED